MELGNITRKSSIYETQPWGNTDQGNFYNAIIELDTPFSPGELLIQIKNIEKTVGRKQSLPWGPREIDIDIIFCTNHTVIHEDLHIPHRYFSERKFVLEPMAEINRNFKVAPTDKSIAEYLSNCSDKSKIQKLAINW
jgi:2-amino-4-hydroxy-6-hydroxymethyldihydropteridine diphosphokinase